MKFSVPKINWYLSVQANYMDAWKCVATLRGDGQAASESLPASLGKQGFTKLPMSSHQANWHWTIVNTWFQLIQFLEI